MSVKMDSSLQDFRFSKHFNQLTYLGVWSNKSMDPSKKKYYTVYQIFILCWTTISASFQLADLFLGIGSLRKVTLNLCITTLNVSYITRILIIIRHKKESLEHLRMSLWEDSRIHNDEEDAALIETAFEKLQYICKWFYRAGTVFFTIWIIASYFSYVWGPRELPFPAYLPVNTSNEIEFVPALALETLTGGLILKVVIEVQLAIFSVLFQIEAQYKILVKNILKLNEVYQEFDVELSYISKLGLGNQLQKRIEVNRYLKRQCAKKLLKTYIKRQQKLIEYSNKFEFIFNEFMLIHVFGSSLLGVMNGVALTIETYEVGVKLCYQAGYLSLILIDLLFICNHVAELATQCSNVGEALYMTSWHKMDLDLRKTICLIIIRSQKPPRITCGKFFLVNMSTYLHLLKNIYSWLMLFRQLEMKQNQP